MDHNSQLNITKTYKTNLYKFDHITLSSRWPQSKEFIEHIV